MVGLKGWMTTQNQLMLFFLSQLEALKQKIPEELLPMPRTSRLDLDHGALPSTGVLTGPLVVAESLVWMKFVDHCLKEATDSSPLWS